MRLISQDGMIDVPYENVIIACEKNRDDKFSIYARCSHCLGMATYSTEDKALKVMEMVRKQYMRNNALYIDRENNARVMPQNSLFQFPADDEVEV